MRALLFATLAAAACSIPEKHAGNGAVDAPAGTIDAPTTSPDAPATFDAAPAFACNGMTPTTAPAQVTLSGTIYDPFTGTMPPGATVQAYQNGNLVTSMPADGSGHFSLTVPTGGVPIDNAYVKVIAPGQVDTYIYPGAPIDHDLTSSVFSITGSEYMTFTGGSSGIFGFATDCLGQSLAGVTIAASSGSVEYFTMSGQFVMTPPTDSSGLFVVTNVPVGNTLTISGSINGITMRAHMITPVPNSLSQTFLQP